MFKRRYAMGHRLISGLSEKCGLPHGHNEVVTVTLRAIAPTRLDGRANMVEPFEHAKSVWHRWIDEHVDHSLHLSAGDPLLDWFAVQESQRLMRILVTPGDPTTEMLAACMMAKLNAFLVADGDRLTCTAIRIDETPTNTVIFEGDPLAFLPRTDLETPWWSRADMTINDLVPATRPALGEALGLTTE